MNERIKELLEQAGAKYVTMPKDTVYEKFAELIVKECAELFPERHYYYSGLAVKRNIKEHFGVEE